MKVRMNLKIFAIVFLSLILSVHSAIAAVPSNSQMVGNVKGSRLKQIFQDRLSREKAEAEKMIKPIAEATVAVQSAGSALQALEGKDIEKAQADLAAALGKLDVVSAQNPLTKLVPISVVVRVLDVTADEEALKAKFQEINNLVRNNALQAARPLLVQLASEINVEATNISMATFPNALRDAVAMVGAGQLLAARAELMAALNGFVLTELIVPLPLIKAQTFIDEVNRQIADKKIDKEQADQLLTGAQEQLNLAELLGYGSPKKDFSSMRLAINQLKKDIHQEKEDKGILSRLIDDLKSLWR